MNREVKFRGLVRTGRWVYGSLVLDRGETYIYWRDEAGLHKSAVLPETVGQWTGYHDCTGKEIYEDDLYKWGGLSDVLEVKWTQDSSWDGGSWSGYDFNSRDCERMKVIGNRHDNPELLTQEPTHADK